MRASISARRGSRSGAGPLTYSSRGNACDSWNSSSRPEISMPGPTHPYRCQYRPTNTSLCARYARYSSCGGCGRAPSSNITGVNRNAEMARDTACRSSASSPSVELTNTRRRWSGVRITSSCRQPFVPRSPPDRFHPASLGPAGPTGNTPRHPTWPGSIVSRQRTRCCGRNMHLQRLVEEGGLEAGGIRNRSAGLHCTQICHSCTCLNWLQMTCAGRSLVQGRGRRWRVLLLGSAWWPGTGGSP